MKSDRSWGSGEGGGGRAETAPTTEALWSFVDLNQSVTGQNFQHLYAELLKCFLIKKKKRGQTLPDTPLPLIPSAPVELLSSRIIPLPWGGRGGGDENVNATVERGGDAEEKLQPLQGNPPPLG